MAIAMNTANTFKAKTGFRRNVLDEKRNTAPSKGTIAPVRAMAINMEVTDGLIPEVKALIIVMAKPSSDSSAAGVELPEAGAGKKPGGVYADMTEELAFLCFEELLKHLSPAARAVKASMQACNGRNVLDANSCDGRSRPQYGNWQVHDVLPPERLLVHS